MLRSTYCPNCPKNYLKLSLSSYLHLTYVSRTLTLSSYHLRNHSASKYVAHFCLCPFLFLSRNNKRDVPPPIPHLCSGFHGSRLTRNLTLLIIPTTSLFHKLNLSFLLYASQMHAKIPVFPFFSNLLTSLSHSQSIF